MSCDGSLTAAVASPSQAREGQSQSQGKGFCFVKVHSGRCQDAAVERNDFPKAARACGPREVVHLLQQLQLEGQGRGGNEGPGLLLEDGQGRGLETVVGVRG